MALFVPPYMKTHFFYSKLAILYDLSITSVCIRLTKIKYYYFLYCKNQFQVEWYCCSL